MGLKKWTMMFSAAAAALIAPVPALGQADNQAAPEGSAAEAPASPITITGNVALVSQYRLRGVSLSDEKPALQGTITAIHDSGFYAGTFASSLSGYGSVGGANLELDAFAGYATQVGKVTLDAGVFWYLYPGTDRTDFVEIYGSVSAPVGPVSAKLGAYYAPERDSAVLGNGDNLYLYLDGNSKIPSTPVTLKAHVGRSAGKGTYLSGPDGTIIDWMVGADGAIHGLTLGVSYVDTDIGRTEGDLFYNGIGGHNIVDGAVLLSITASF